MSGVFAGYCIDFPFGCRSEHTETGKNEDEIQRNDHTHQLIFRQTGAAGADSRQPDNIYVEHGDVLCIKISLSSGSYLLLGDCFCPTNSTANISISEPNHPARSTAVSTPAVGTHAP